MMKLIAINLSKEEAIRALVEYAFREKHIAYRGPGEMSAMIFQEDGELKQVRVEVEYDLEVEQEHE